jgi:hypothetical protein
MFRDLQTQDDFTQRRLQRLELGHRRAHFVLAGAQTVYDSLRAMPGADEPRLCQALQRVEQAQQQRSREPRRRSPLLSSWR